MEASVGASSSAVLSAYAEPLLRGRRVAVLGDATQDLAAAVAQRGARLVHVYDADPIRVALALSTAARGGALSFAVLGEDLGVRDGAFDVVLVPDLSLFDDAGELVRRARRLTSPNGVALFASPNASIARTLLPRRAARGNAAPGYYDLFDAVSLQFSVVRMLGQAPFVGYTLADFAPDSEPEVTVDTSLLAASEEPEWFIAVASERPVELEAYSVIELPFADVGFTHAAALPPTERHEEDRAALAEAQAGLALLRVELDNVRERNRETSRAAEVSSAALSSRVVELENELLARDKRLHELEARAGDAHVRGERLAHALSDLETELRSQRDRATKLAKQLDDERRGRQKVELELGMLRNSPELKERDARIRQLSTELDQARTRVTELEVSVTQRAPTAPDPALVLRIAELEAAMRDAQREVVTLTSEREVRVRSFAVELADAKRARENVPSENAEEADDVGALERVLHERGRRVSTLERELRYSERIGRELIEQLTTSALIDPTSAEEGDMELRRRLDALATKAAQCEAELQAMSWRNIQLEQRVADAATSGT
jgi:SAM-dependent methyltransferase